MARLRRRASPLVFGVVVWAASASLGVAAITRYSLAPGEASDAPSTWPVEAPLRFDAERANLVMAIHPRCPCSRASLEELAKLMAHIGHRASAHVVFVVPPNADEAWTASVLWEQAGAIPGVERVRDGGEIAARLGVATSGHTLLYGPRGELLFSGGITAARGHSGDNPGSAAITSLLLGGADPADRTLVFGCALFDLAWLRELRTWIGTSAADGSRGDDRSERS